MSDQITEEIDEAFLQETRRRADATRKVMKASDDQTSAPDVHDLSKGVGFSGGQMGTAPPGAIDKRIAPR